MEFVMNIILSSVRMATPLIFLALAELYSQRAGLVHIGLEGLASIGSLVGFLVSLITGSPMLGVLAGAAVGILVNMIFAYATVTLCAEQIVYGMDVEELLFVIVPILSRQCGCNIFKLCFQYPVSGNTEGPPIQQSASIVCAVF